MCTGPGTAWVFLIADGNDNLSGKYPSLELDANNWPHISYYDETEKCLRYTYWDGTKFVYQKADDSPEVGMFTSLELDAAGHPHIAYFADYDDDLKYAYLRWELSGMQKPWQRRGWWDSTPPWRWTAPGKRISLIMTCCRPD